MKSPVVYDMSKVRRQGLKVEGEKLLIGRESNMKVQS